MTDRDPLDPPPARDLIGAARAEADAPGVCPSHAAPGEGEGDRIGDYELLQKIGEGGMGTVWMAQQAHPVRRKVALKIVKLGMDTREVLARFEVERQALAMMEHPNIARVFDGGATEQGRPYFVMELVRGTPITEYCDLARLDISGRLDLFRQVCGAIQHAHHKGVIHRDIKPSNVMITLFDGVPVPKVIDFGIAKATSAELTQHTIFTRYAQIIGTPDYMAPEQAELSGLDIDTRADVYSLGVLLYELLTGTVPHDLQATLRESYEEMLRTIREVDPATPSTRISTLGAKASPIAGHRHVQAGELARTLRGDLDWIVMMALEKDRTRRYETPLDLARDVERHLRGEPVVAAPAGRVYRLRKFVSRNRGAVVTTAAIALLVITGAVGTGLGWWKAARANARLDDALLEVTAALNRETAERERAEENEQRAVEAKQEALARAEERDRIARFHSHQLQELDPMVMGGGIRNSLLEAAAKLGGEKRRALLEAQLEGVNMTTVALDAVQESLVGPTLAAIEEQFADEPLIQADLLEATGILMDHLGLHEASIAPLRRGLEIKRRELGDEHPDTLSARAYAALTWDAAKREELLGEVLASQRRIMGEDAKETAWTRIRLSVLLEGRGDLEQALEQSTRALETYRQVLGNDDEHTIAAMADVGRQLSKCGHPEEAGVLVEECLEACRRALGSHNRATLLALNNLGSLRRSQGRLEEAEAHYREAAEIGPIILGALHPMVAMGLNNLGNILGEMGRFEEAEVKLREGVEFGRRILGKDHPNMLKSAGNLGRLLMEQSRLAEAEPLLREAAGSFRRNDPKSPDTATSFGLLAVWLELRIAQSRSSGPRADLGRSLAELGEIRLLQGAAAEAESLLHEGWEILVEELAAEHWRKAATTSAWGAAVAAQGRFEEAEELLIEGYEALTVAEPMPPEVDGLGGSPLPLAIERLISCYEAWDRADPGEGHDGSALEWRAQLEGLRVR